MEKTGIINRAVEAREKTEEAEREEKEKLGDMEDTINEYTTGIKIEQVTDENPGVLEGSGTDDDPYTINSIEDLVFFAYDVTNGNNYEGEYISLGLDLDFNSTKSYVDAYRTDYEIYGYDGELKTMLTSGEGFKTIGSINDSTKTFKGNFNGNNNTIINLYIKINSTNETIVGLFANNEGNIRNLGVENCSIELDSTGTTGTGMVGGIVGYNRATGIIENCFTTGKVIGTTNGTIAIRLGGIVGNAHGKILSCYSGILIESYQTGRVSIGGIIGSGNADIENCYNYGNIIVRKASSGVVGGITSGGNGIIKNCYNLGDIIINSTESSDIWINVGGIVGECYNDINNCYNNCILDINLSNGNIGNFVGILNKGTVEGGYFRNNENASIGKIELGTDQSTSIQSINEMPSILSIIGNNFKEDTNNINNRYPILSWQ